mgnify:CR=1 FL=1
MIQVETVRKSDMIVLGFTFDLGIKMLNFFRKKPSSINNIESQNFFQTSSDVVLIIETEFLRILLRHIKTLVIKYEQSIYRDDYGSIKLDKASQEIIYFINRVVKNGLLTASLPNHIPREAYLSVLDNFLNDSECQADWAEQIEQFLSITDEEELIDVISGIASGYAGYLSAEGRSNETLDFLFGADYKSVIEMVRTAMAEKKIIQIGSIMRYLIDLKDLTSLQKWFSERRENGIDISDVVTGQEFENFCQKKLEYLGWEVKTTKTSGDFGADLVIEKSNVSIIVQCKYYSQPVGVKAVQEVFSAMTFYSAHRSVVVSNHSFTKAARQMAEKNNVMLLNINELDKLDK